MGLLDSAKSLAGSVVDMHAHAAGDALDFVGLHDAAHSVDKWGDEVADDLGAGVGELNLGESEDPKELLHGDAKAIAERVQHLMKFAAAFEAVATGLARMDSDHWKGKAADAFRSKFSGQPTAWRVMADACEAAAKGLAPLAGTVTWAQGQAKQAIDLYRKSEQATREAQDSYNRQADDYNRALKAYQSAGDASATAPTRPAQFHDPGAALRKQAAELLTAARRQRVSAAGAAAQALRAATANAPKEPGVMDRIGMALQDAPAVLAVGALHFEGGVVKGAADMLKFARGVNPFDVYNMTHPALYLDHLNSVAGGLAHTANHPTELVTALVGSGWGSDPSEAGGKAFFNLISGVATGGGSEAAVVAERLGIDAAESAARRAAVEAAENAAKRAAVETGESAGQKAATGLAEHPHPTPTPSNPAGLPDGWTVKPAQTPPTGIDGAVVHEPAPPTAHPASPVHEPPAGVHEGAPPAHEPAPPAHGPALNEPGGPYGVHIEEPQFGRPQPVDDQMRAAHEEMAGGARQFGSKEEAAAYGTQHWKDYAQSLPQSQKDALYAYTKDAPFPGSYEDINGYLRKDGTGSADMDARVADIDKALAGSTLPEDVVISRGTGIKHFDVDDPLLLEGRTFTEKAYVSTSLGDAAMSDKPVVMHLKVPAGTPGMYLGEVSNLLGIEREVLLGRGTRWRADRVIKGPDGKIHIYGEVL
ncbi:putative T7SS-secreted protein [Kitasatospora indigofera]|uniref:putative T7SS-secreted protein n=1 Tax=Kitasatospora indigofera TaxID=67307 RepID=UPI00368F712B